MSHQHELTPAHRPAPHIAAVAVGPGTAAANVTFLEDAMRLMEQEALAARACSADLQALEREHPQWLAEFDDANPDVADLDELLVLLSSAPTAFARGLIKGRIDLRMQMARITLRG